MIGRATRKRAVKPDFEQYELPVTASQKHYSIINHYHAFDRKAKSYYWHSSQIMWRKK